MGPSLLLPPPVLPPPALFVGVGGNTSAPFAVIRTKALLVGRFVNGMAKMLSVIDRDGLKNIRLYDSDALDLLKKLPDASIGRLYLLYPDPWPKRRQNKRRFVSDETLKLIARVLRPGGQFRFASDIDHYVGWTLNHVMRSNEFRWLAKQPDDWRKPWSGWQSTRYELKAIKEGRKSAYLTFERV